MEEFLSLFDDELFVLSLGVFDFLVFPHGIVKKRLLDKFIEPDETHPPLLVEIKQHVQQLANKLLPEVGLFGFLNPLCDDLFIDALVDFKPLG